MRAPLDVNFFTLCYKWSQSFGEEFGALCSVACFSSWAKSPRLGSVAGDRENGELLSNWYLCCSWWVLVEGETVASGLFGWPLLARTPIPWARGTVFRAPYSSWCCAQSRASVPYKWGWVEEGAPLPRHTCPEFSLSNRWLGAGWTMEKSLLSSVGRKGSVFLAL